MSASLIRSCRRISARTWRHILALATAVTANAATFQSDVFVSGQEGYARYRIPAIVKTSDNMLLAFCEARKSATGNSGAIDLVQKSSRDGGRTWSAPTVVWHDADNTCGNPCAVVDAITRVIWLFGTHNLGADSEEDIIFKRAKGTRTPWAMSSSDSGKSWSTPVELTAQLKDPTWGWFATGPGIGIQINSGPNAGRLVIPAVHTYDSPGGNLRGGPFDYGAVAIYSDDHGKSWKRGGTIRPKLNDSQVVELFDPAGRLLMDMRSNAGHHRRAQAFSNDGGMTWTESQPAMALINPTCQASILRWGDSGSSGGRVIFSNPADAAKRIKLTVRLSTDNGKIWSDGLQLHAGPAAYSCLVTIDQNEAGCLFERGEASPYEIISFARFTAQSLVP